MNDTAENKKKYAFWMRPSMVADIEDALKKANADSKSEFVCQAVSFYLGYLYQEKTVNYLSPLLVSTMKSEVRSSTKFICETLFKLAVEQAINSNLVAAERGISDYMLEQLRNSCEQAVAESNGILTAEDAQRWQRG